MIGDRLKEGYLAGQILFDEFNQRVDEGTFCEPEFSNKYKETAREVYLDLGRGIGCIGFILANPVSVAETFASAITLAINLYGPRK